MKPTRKFLRALFLQMAGASIPLAAVGASCGGTSGGGDGGNGGDANCSTPCACYTPPPAITLYVTDTCEGGAGGDGGCTCLSLCPTTATGDAGNIESIGTCVFLVDGGVNQVQCNYRSPACAGRRPAGLARSRADLARIGACLAENARLEAASIVAFERLARELASNGAPDTLARRARRAARDEVRHAKTMTRLARKHGGVVVAPRIAKAKRRSIAKMARENAIEGCVRETWGALLATWQAEHAHPRLRRAMRSIARDETGHAALAWSVAAWADRKLSLAARRSIARARERAIARLHVELAASPPAELAPLGLPSAAQAKVLLDALFEGKMQLRHA